MSISEGVIKGYKYDVSGGNVDIGGLDTGRCQTITTQSTAFSINQLVEVQEVNGTGCWIMIGSDPTAQTDEGAYIPPNGITRPFPIKAGDKIATTGKVNIRPLNSTVENG